VRPFPREAAQAVRAKREESYNMKAWDLLKHDHREVEKLFKQLEDTDDAKEKSQIFAKIKQELELHTKVEEAHLYPVLKRHDKTKSLTEHSLEEHAEVKKLLGQLSKLSPDDAKFAELCEELQGGVEEHVEEEERKLFPLADEVLGKSDIERIGQAIEKEKQSAKAG
jgi:iron-sulfur cluster repair protein YtfE (RIC family)